MPLSKKVKNLIMKPWYSNERHIKIKLSEETARNSKNIPPFIGTFEIDLPTQNSTGHGYYEAVDMFKEFMSKLPERYKKSKITLRCGLSIDYSDLISFFVGRDFVFKRISVSKCESNPCTNAFKALLKALDAKELEFNESRMKFSAKALVKVEKVILKDSVLFLNPQSRTLPLNKLRDIEITSEY